MIKINLLGDDTVIDQGGKLILLGYVGSLAALLVVFAVMQTSINARISDLSRDAEAANVKLVQLKKVTDEVRQLEKQKAELDLITATIAKLKLSQDGPVRVMDDLNMALPSRAWLTEVAERSGQMRLTGLALTDHEVVTFMKNLETSGYFDVIDLKESIAVSLVKVSAYNHYNTKFTRYVVRAEEKAMQLRKIQTWAKKNGLKYTNTEGPPELSLSSTGTGTVKVMSTDKILGGGTNIGSGVFKKGSSRLEKVSAWASVQPVPAKAFTIVAHVLYAGKLKTLLTRQEENQSATENIADKAAEAATTGSS